MTIPDSVTSIGNYAFDWCTSLTSVTIGDSVTSIGDNAFYYCSALTSITLPAGVVIGQNAFSSCHSSLYTEYAYGKYVAANGNPYAILYELTNKNLSTYTIHEDTQTIGYGVFSGCTRLATITIPNSVTSIGYEAFRGCSALTSVHISDIGAWCNISFGSSDVNPLYYAKNLYLNGELVTEVVIPDGVTELKNYVFYNCKNLTSVTIPDSVTSIGNAAFSSCSALTSVTIGDSVTSIGDEAFYNCTSLTSVTIPDSVTSIGYRAFYNFYALTSVTFENTEGWWVSEDANATSGTELSFASLADPATVARYLRSTYHNYYWKRG